MLAQDLEHVVADVFQLSLDLQQTTQHDVTHVVLLVCGYSRLARSSKMLLARSKMSSWSCTTLIRHVLLYKI